MAKRKRLTKKQRETRNRWLLGILVAGLIFIIGYFAGQQRLDLTNVQQKLDDVLTQMDERISAIELPEMPSNREEYAGTTQIHVLDVGQGSALLLIAQDGNSVLLDSGRYDDEEKRIVSYLDRFIGLGNPIDLVLFTHNDSDHIGHGDLVLDYFDVQEVWMNGMPQTSEMYHRLIESIGSQNLAYLEPKAGENFTRGPFELQVLSPTGDSPRTNSNDESIVTRILYDNLSIMTSGDASLSREGDVLDRGGDLQSDFILLGHHGARDSSSQKWLEAVQPQMAFYQAGLGNSYGHPHAETLERLEHDQIPYYGTDELGTISIYIDKENNVTVETER